MLPGACLIARKDIGLLLFQGRGMVQAALLGLLLIFLFSLAGSGSEIPESWIAAVFWLASCFSLVLIFNGLYAVEEESLAREGLLMAPIPVQSVWLGKALAGGLLLLLLQLLFLPAGVVFLGAGALSSWTAGAGLLFSVDAGLILLGSLFGALGQGHSTRESLLSVILFPLQVPLIMAGIHIGASLLATTAETGDLTSWYGLILAFDAVFAGAGLILFPFVYAE
ncbi:MAG: heme exporter protein CcmB [Desulfohalobiaceae bacterium]|nr:heme exporter protein CcmB [Desulfohalobiaceae bacterium]MCF8085377.1 heme exporter protein CcmB [Desulfohalobiaceae bacterium]